MKSGGLLLQIALAIKTAADEVRMFGGDPEIEEKAIMASKLAITTSVGSRPLQGALGKLLAGHPEFGLVAFPDKNGKQKHCRTHRRKSCGIQGRIWWRM